MDFMASQSNQQDDQVAKAKALKYSNYLEEMELKIRYMKNDIEFKKAQLKKSEHKKNITSAVKQQTIPSLSKDQYRLTKSLTRPDYDVQVRTFCKNNSLQNTKIHSLQHHPQNAFSNFERFKTFKTFDAAQQCQTNNLQAVLTSKRFEVFNQKNTTDSSKTKVSNATNLRTVLPPKKSVDPKANTRTVLLPSKVITEKCKPKLTESSSPRKFDDKTPSSCITSAIPADGSFKSVSKVTSSRYKLVKPTAKTEVASSQALANKFKYKTKDPNVSGSFNSNVCQPQSIHMLPDFESKQKFENGSKSKGDKVLPHTLLRINTPNKIVNKYKLKRLSPPIRSKSRSPLEQISLIKKSRFKLDKRNNSPLLAKSSPTVRKINSNVNNQNSSLAANNAISNLKQNKASRIVNKYKFRRQHIESSSLGVICQTVRYKSKMKLDRRPLPEKMTGKSPVKALSSYRYKRKVDKRHQFENSVVKRTKNINRNIRHFRNENIYIRRFGPQKQWQPTSQKLSDRYKFIKPSSKNKIQLKKQQYNGRFVWNSKNIQLKGHARINCNPFPSHKYKKTFGNPSKYKYKRIRSISSSQSIDPNKVKAANRALHKSIVIAAGKYKKNNQTKSNSRKYCKFFIRFGKCHKLGECPFIHDPEKVAVCTRFLRGKCEITNCQFSHKASVHKMPVCLFYLQGSCHRESCPYLHVNVNPKAPVCRDFLNGFCSAGEQCKKLHSHVCPSFAVSGSCQRGSNCPMLHRQTSKPQQTSPLKTSKRKKNIRPCGSSDSCKVKNSGTSEILRQDNKTLTSQPSFISLETKSTQNCAGDDGTVEEVTSVTSQEEASDQKQKITPSFMIIDHR